MTKTFLGETAVGDADVSGGVDIADRVDDPGVFIGRDCCLSGEYLYRWLLGK